MLPVSLHIEILRKYKSIEPGKIDFPAFVVISGKNGSGKTQLLEALKDDQLSELFSVAGESLSIRRFFPLGSLQPNSSDANLGASIQTYNEYTAAKTRRMGNGSPHLDFKDRLKGSLKRRVQIVAKFAGKEIEDLNQGDFIKHAPIDDASSDFDPFSQNVEAIFNRYADKQLENELQEFDRSKKRGGDDYLHPSEFLNKFGDPVSEFNTLLESAGFGYQFNRPPDLSAYERIHGRNSSFSLRLIDDISKDEITLNDLSSGEKVILSLVFALYNSHKDYDFPKVLLLDEPDAYLHPSMIQQFLSVINDVFVKRGSIVIMTTHSPSTIALAPDSSLFSMDRRNRRPQKVSREFLLASLLDGVPALRVDYENRRQVFVESSNDVYFYERFYDAVADKLQSARPLHFISSGSGGSGDSSQVRIIVKELRSSGNRTVFGIIDWDGENTECDGVLIAGVRDAIENYVFDPLILAVYLLRQTNLDTTDLGLSSKKSYLDIQHLKQDELQTLVEHVVHRVGKSLNQASDREVDLNYAGGLKLISKEWYFQLDGHKLHEAVVQSFPFLKACKKLENDILAKVLGDFPDFTPQELLNLFKRIQDS